MLPNYVPKIIQNDPKCMIFTGVMGRLQGVFLNKIPPPEVAFTLTEVSAKRKFSMYNSKYF